ncbi:hypothetical protein [Streptomyces sp. NPDC057686]|uniref:hypothetical protein n=1 Tax=Streptomyces sp. NPDC057686 TaxID=3346212 RepID=UPI0036AE4938
MTGRRGLMVSPGADREPAPGVADPATGEIRILEDRCTTCVLNPARTAIPLPAGRRAEFVREARDDEQAYVVCHKTFGEDAPPGTREAMCRGYINAYGLPPAVRAALDFGIGHLVEVPKPGTGTPPDGHRHGRAGAAAGAHGSAASPSHFDFFDSLSGVPGARSPSRPPRWRGPPADCRR